MSRAAARRPAVFLDRDGTVSRYREYCRRAEDFELLPGAGAAISQLNAGGLLVFIVTNQSAVGRGWLTPEGLERIHEKLRRLLSLHGAHVDAIYVCPHRPGEGCSCRKPGPGMFAQAAREWPVALGRSYAVGDRALDVLSGRAAGATTILVRSGHAPEPQASVRPDVELPSLVEAAAWILQRERAEERAGTAAATRLMER